MTENMIIELLKEGYDKHIHDSTNATMARSKTGMEYPLNVNL